MPKWTRAQRKRYQDELRTDTKPDVRDIFLTPKMKRKRKSKSRSGGADPSRENQTVDASGRDNIMPALATEQEVYTFDQLSDSAKETARQWMRETDQFDTDWLYKDFETAGKILGIEFDANNGLSWSGFCCQGDGASFTGSYHHAPQSPAKIRAEYPTDTALHAIADGLDAIQNVYKLLSGNRIDAVISQSGNYCHEMTMDIEYLRDSVTGEDFDYLCDTQKRILELMRDFARWMYKRLEAEHDYRNSDEEIDETIRANEYEFDEDGERV